MMDATIKAAQSEMTEVKIFLDGKWEQEIKDWEQWV